MKIMNRKESKKIAVMAVVIMGFMMFAFMPMASAGVTYFGVDPVTGYAGTTDSYNMLVDTTGVQTLNITIPPGFIAVPAVTSGDEILTVQFYNITAPTKGFYGIGIVTANATDTVDVSVRFGIGGVEVTGTITENVDYTPGVTTIFESPLKDSHGDTSTVTVKLPTEIDGGYMNITIMCTLFYLESIGVNLKQCVRNPMVAGDYVFSANGEDATVTIKETGTYGGAVHRGRQWILRTENSPLAQVFRTNWGLATDTPITGDWDGDGVDTIGLRRGNQWILSNSNTNPNADIRRNWGLATDTPVVGDWDSDGVDTIGVRRGNQWILSNSNTDPNADIRRNWGMATDTPVVGDWSNGGRDTMGVRRDNQWILSNSNTNPDADIRRNWGLATDTPVVGDWDNDGRDTIGVRRGNQWILSNSNTAPVVAYRFNYGMSTDTPLTGKWI
jgi:hypothetical protein